MRNITMRTAHRRRCVPETIDIGAKRFRCADMCVPYGADARTTRLVQSFVCIWIGICSSILLENVLHSAARERFTTRTAWILSVRANSNGFASAVCTRVWARHRSMRVWCVCCQYIGDTILSANATRVAFVTNVKDLFATIVFAIRVLKTATTMTPLTMRS